MAFHFARVKFTVHFTPEMTKKTAAAIESMQVGLIVDGLP